MLVFMVFARDFKQIKANTFLFRVKKERDEIKNDLSESITDVSCYNQSIYSVCRQMILLAVGFIPNRT